jgi:hypothetical protein
VTVPHRRVTRCQICRRTVTCRPGTLSQILTGHYRRLFPKRRPPVLVAGRRALRCPQMPPRACAGPGRTCHRAWPEDAGGHGDAGSAIQAAVPAAFPPITAGRQISAAIGWLAARHEPRQ